jgi:hypothetical protein
MFEKFQPEGCALPSWQSLREDDIIHANDFVEDLASGKRLVVGRSVFYKFLVGQRAGQARLLPDVVDVVRVG